MERTFVIIEADPIVSLDVVGAVKSAYPRCDAILATSMSEAELVLPQALGRVCMIVSRHVASPRAQNTLRDVALGGGQVVFLGSLPEVDFPAAAVSIPFTTTMILDVLQRDEPDQHVHPPEVHT